MDHVARISVFLAVAEAQSFAGAARMLGITSSAVSKQIQNLEFDLKVKLLNRTTRKVSLTEEGTIYYERASRALEDLKEAEEQIYELKSHPRGPLKVSLPLSLGIKYFTQPIAAFAAKYPDVELNVSLDDRFVDIAAENFDLALRIGSLNDTSMIARKLASCPFALCASESYLSANGTPKTPDDLSKHSVLAYTRNNGLHEWRYKDPDGNTGQVGLTGSFKSDSGDILCQAALEGIGIVMLPIFYVAEHLEEGGLRSILTDYETWPKREIYAVFPPNRFQSKRLRLFVDHLVSSCNKLPWEVED